MTLYARVLFVLFLNLLLLKPGCDTQSRTRTGASTYLRVTNFIARGYDFSRATVQESRSQKFSWSMRRTADATSNVICAAFSDIVYIFSHPFTP